MPRLPRPRELKPFPNALCVEYVGHASRVQCLACSGDGQWLASGDEDGMVIVWEVRCVVVVAITVLSVNPGNVALHKLGLLGL